MNNVQLYFPQWLYLAAARARSFSCSCEDRLVIPRGLPKPLPLPPSLAGLTQYRVRSSSSGLLSAENLKNTFLFYSYNIALFSLHYKPCD